MDNNQFDQNNEIKNDVNDAPEAATPAVDPVVIDDKKKGADVFGIISLVCGILGIVFNCCGCCAYIVPVLAIAAIVLAVVGKNKSADASFSGLAKAGLICGIVGIAFFLACFIIGFIIGLSGGMEEMIEEIMYELY